MIRPDDLPPVCPAAATLMMAMRADDYLTRAAFAGVPFVRQARRRDRSPRLEAAEAMVLDLIERGVMRSVQQAAEWPGRAPARPFTVMLTPIGVQIRAQLRTGRTTAANDDIAMAEPGGEAA